MKFPNPLRIFDAFSRKRDPSLPKPSRPRWGRCRDLGRRDKSRYTIPLRSVSRAGVRIERIAVSRVGVLWYWEDSGHQLSIGDCYKLMALKAQAEVTGFDNAEETQ